MSKREKYSLSQFFKQFPIDPEHDGHQNPTTSEICIPKSSKGNPIPYEIERAVIQHLCFSKFYSFCHDTSYHVRDDINRGITQFNEFVNSLYHTNFRKYSAIVRCYPEGLDRFIEFMVLKYISRRMIEMQFLFDRDGNGIVYTRSRGVYFDEYCLPKEKPTPVVSILPILGGWYSSDHPIHCNNLDYDDLDYRYDDGDYPEYPLDPIRVPKSQRSIDYNTQIEEDESDKSVSDEDHLCDFTNDKDYLNLPPDEMWTYYDQEGNQIAPP